MYNKIHKSLSVFQLSQPKLQNSNLGSRSTIQYSSNSQSRTTTQSIQSTIPNPNKTLQNSSGTTLNDYVMKESSKRYFNTTRIVGTARVGYGHFTLFGTYQFTNLFKDGAAIECFCTGFEPVKGVLINLEGKLPSLL
ncbi:hypothetical protein EON78_03710 [bacterium]|nr:MAG: hypothetical protein EON78_03710 [bacterium]